MTCSLRVGDAQKPQPRGGILRDLTTEVFLSCGKHVYEAIQFIFLMRKSGSYGSSYWWAPKIDPSKPPGGASSQPNIQIGWRLVDPRIVPGRMKIQSGATGLVLCWGAVKDCEATSYLQPKKCTSPCRTSDDSDGTWSFLSSLSFSEKRGCACAQDCGETISTDVTLW